MADEYIAGVCNIGAAEIRQRMRVSMIGLALAIAVAAGLLMSDAPRASRWLVGLPLMMWATGLVQARHRFCMAYGLRGAFNFGKVGAVSQVQDPAFLRADRITAYKIVGLSLVYALAATLGFVLLPV